VKAWVAVVGLAAAAGWAQQEWVQLERSNARLALAREELRRVDALAVEGLVSQAELLRTQAELRLAELDFRDALWQFQGSRLRVVVADAVRTTGLDGLDTITLTLELPPLGVGSISMPVGEAQLGVADVQVSLADKGVVVGFPYARVVPYLSPGERVEVAFELLRPVETPTVTLEYRGNKHEMTLYPRVAVAEAPFRLMVAQPSLAVVFGEEARFHLVFESLQQRSLTLDVELRNLPETCLGSFRERQSGATVSSLRLGAGSGPKEVELLVRLPPGPLGTVLLDVPLEFELVARYTLRDRRGEVTQPLRITPVGTPKLELRAPSWLVETTAGQELGALVEVVNVGTAPAQGVRVYAESPAELLGRLEPAEVATITVGERARFTLWLRATKEAMAGEYSVRLQPRAANLSLAQGEAAASLRVRVRSSRGWVVPVSSAVLLAGLALLGMKMVRRFRFD